ncbi:OstA-like protein [Balneola sp. MJW-20]|uniref:OstA-like protein n=1 Tax=Gracilimonas aurantiaca TaxID=3234185 RepID=UPI003465E3FD
MQCCHKYGLFGLLIFLSLQFTESFAQNTIDILDYESIDLIQTGTESLQKIYKPVLRNDQALMSCDSAYSYQNTNEIHLFGNIQIETDTELIWSDTLYYYEDRDLSNLRGRVVIVQDSSTLYGEKVDYNFFTKIAYFRDGIRLEDPQGTLIADRGTYFQNLDSAIFRGNVQLADTAQYAEGDSLFINRKRQFLQLYSNIFVQDSTNQALLTGDFLEADSTGRRFVDGNAYLRRISSDTTDTSHINADQILLLEEDSSTYIRSYTDVRIWSERFSSRSDTALYNSEEEIFRLTASPRAWHKNIQLTGPFISVQLDSNQVRQLISYYKPIAVQEDSVTGRLNQIKGDTLTVNFTDGNISTIILRPDSKVLYHTRNEEGDPDGAVEYISPRTVMYFNEGELQQVKAGQNQGVFLPEYSGLADRRLEGFSWDPADRPQKPVMDLSPRFPPVTPDPPFSLPPKYLFYLKNL